MEYTNQAPRFTTMMLAGWLMLTAVLAGCATSPQTGPGGELSQESSAPHSSPLSEPLIRDSSRPEVIADTTGASPVEAAQYQTPVSHGLVVPTWQSLIDRPGAASCSVLPVSNRRTDAIPPCELILIPTFEERRLGNEVPLRPPLRTLWFNHNPLVPLGDDVDFNIPHSDKLAQRGHFRSGPFRNPYGGLRDQPLLHRDTSRDPVTDSKQPEIGPPPPKHTIKSMLTLGGLSLIGAGVYAFGPSGFTGTNKEGQWQDAWGHFKEAWTKPPVFDKDGSGVNYVGHPYFGANFYLSQRNLGESPFYSFVYSVFCSTFFEYMLESWSERPSINDLIVTPLVGSILGELVFLATQEMREGGFTTGEKIIVTVINPLYVLQNGYR